MLLFMIIIFLVASCCKLKKQVLTNYMQKFIYFYLKSNYFRRYFDGHPKSSFKFMEKCGFVLYKQCSDQYKKSEKTCALSDLRLKYTIVECLCTHDYIFTQTK